MQKSGMLSAYKIPQGRLNVVLDTDTYNEIDDQFAIAYLLQSGDALNLKGITVAPFLNKKAKDIPDGLQKSRAEIIKLLELMHREEFISDIYMGSDTFLADENTPVDSAACDFLLDESRKYSPENPLYVVGIGACTNIASAILKDPLFSARVVIVWLGGSAWGWWRNHEFNMYQDYSAARVLLRGAERIVQLPCQGVVSEFITSEFELEHWLKGKNAVSDYLYRNTVRVASQESPFRTWSRVLWDVTAVAWLLNENNRFMEGRLEKRRLPAYEGRRYENESLSSELMYVYQIHRDALMSDLFDKLGRE